MRIIIDDLQEKIEVTSKICNIIEQTLNASVKYEKFKKRCEIGVSLVDNEQIQILNKEHRGLDKPTDVLSFPMIDFNTETDDKYSRDRGFLLLGDIVISLEKAFEQANEYGHSIEREVGFLCVHSTLHLLGYDHINEQDTAVMRGKEEEILQLIKLSR